MTTQSTGPRAPMPSWRIILGGAALYALCWSLLPPLLAPGLPLDVIEGISWGHEWQRGYYKHPPLSSWVLYVFYRLFGRIGPYLLSQLCIWTTVWLVWRTGCRLMSRERALLGAALLMGVIHYTRPALEFNHNIAQMPIWAALGWLLLAALQDGRLRQWLAFGLVAGLGLLTKYSVGVLLLCLALYVLLSPQRRVLRGPGPWLAVLTAMLVAAPHLHWLWQFDWLPMEYASSRAAGNSAGALRETASFLTTQLLNHLPLSVIVLVAAWGAHRRVGAGTWGIWASHPGYLLVLALAPGLLTMLLGLVSGAKLHDMWGGPMWGFSGLLLAAALPDRWFRPMQPALWRGLAVWLILASALVAVELVWVGQWRQRPARTDWPQRELAAEAMDTWNRYSNCPLDVVAGNYWLAGIVATQARPQASVLIDGNLRFSPWVTPERLAQHGALWLAQGSAAGASTSGNPVNGLSSASGLVSHTGEWQVPWRGGHEALLFQWRVWVPPACAHLG